METRFSVTPVLCASTITTAPRNDELRGDARHRSSALVFFCLPSRTTRHSNCERRTTLSPRGGNLALTKSEALGCR